MTVSPILSGNVFNLFYGAIFDKHSIIDDSGNRICHQGIECYHSAYLITLGSCALGLAAAFWVIRQDKTRRVQTNH
jgi:hypothetical protein